jgi:hypothetical protein
MQQLTQEQVNEIGMMARELAARIQSESTQPEVAIPALLHTVTVVAKSNGAEFSEVIALFAHIWNTTHAEPSRILIPKG